MAHLALCAAVVAPIALRPGWPLGHDIHPLFQRVEAFRREFAAGNLLPLWTPFGNNGHGMPMPLFYHRLFSTGAGLLALVVGTVPAVKIALIPTLALGSAGMVAAARELGCPPWIRFWSGAVLPLAHYTFVNWLIRGAAAELTAGMLVPWLVVACLRMQTGEAFGARLGAVLALLFYAHISICLYAELMIIIAVIGTLIDRRRALPAAAPYLSRGLGIAAAIVAVFAGPTALAISLVSPEFHVERYGMYVPQRQIGPWTQYFIDSFPWGQTWEGLCVEIGRFLIAALLATGIIAMAKRARVRALPFVFLAASALVYYWLQLPLAAGFYRAVKISQILQFPWRLLVFITPLVILMIAVLARAVLELGGRWAFAATGILAGAWAAQASVAMAAYRADYAWMSPRALDAEVDQLDVQTGGREFLPRDFAATEAPPRTELVRLDGCRLVSSNVDLRLLDRRPFETLELRLESTAGCTVHLSQFWTTLVRVRASAGAQVTRAPDQTTDVILPPGPGTVQIDRRGLLRTIGHALRQRMERLARHQTVKL